jgi:hypothetical protein
LKPYLSVGETKTSLQNESLTEPQVNFLDVHDEGVLALKHNEDLVLDDLPLDVDLTSRELCMRDDEEEVGKLTHELHMDSSLEHSSSFKSSMAVRTREDVSGTYVLTKDLLMRVECEEHSNLYGVVEHIPCGLDIKEVCAPTYSGNGYIEDMDTSIWDCGAIPSERILDRDFKHTIKFGWSKGKELIDELHQETYSSKIYLRLGYHQTTSGCHYGHYELLFMPLGLTNTLATF